jgi:hypothetical protein
MQPSSTSPHFSIDPVLHVLDVAVEEVSDLLDGGAKR